MPTGTRTKPAPKPSPMADKPEKESPIAEVPPEKVETPEGTDPWAGVVSTRTTVPVLVQTSGRPKRTEKEVPESIRKLVEDNYKVDEYHAVVIKNDELRAQFIKHLRSYAYLREGDTEKIGGARLTVRVTEHEGGEVRYSVTDFKPRAKKGEKKADEKKDAE